MKTISRRDGLKRIGVTVASAMLAGAWRPMPGFAAEAEMQPKPTEAEAAAMAEIARQTMEKYKAPGLSVAVARHGQMVYQRGFGYADKASGEAVTSASLFRIASISKPITATAIFSLIEQGRLGLNDLIFGAAGILEYMNVTRMDAHGGWIATPGDLVQFARHVDGFTTTPNILAADTIKTMTTASAQNPNYACGWCVNLVPNWWHSGSLPGTLSIMVRTASGLCWAAITNTRVEGLDLDGMMWRMVKAVPAWRA